MAGEVVASQVVGKVTGDISGLKKAYQQAKDETNAHASWLKGVLGGIASTAGGMLAATGLEMGLQAIVGGIVEVVKSAGDFQASMTRLVTSAGELGKNLPMVSAGILQMSIDTATSTQQLAAGMYYVESSGFHAADALNVLKAAAQGARTENADLDTVATALTTVMHDYGMKASDAASAMNGLIQTVKNGKVNLQDLSASMGAVLPIASALGINFANVAGVLDTMTNAGIPAEQATQNLAHVLIALEAPSKVAVKAMQSVGLSSQDLADTLKNKGLPEALQQIEDAVGTKFPAGSVAYETALKNILGGLVGLKLAAQLTGDNLKLTQQNIDAVSAAMNNGKGAVDGWTEVQGTFNFKIDAAKEALQALGIKIGTYVLPILGNLADFFTQNLGPTLDNIGTLFQQLGQAFEDAFNDKNGQKVKNLQQLGQDLLGQLKQLGGYLHDNLVPFLKDMATAAGHITDWISNSKQAFDNVRSWWKDWGGLITGAAAAITVWFIPAMIAAGATATAKAAVIAATWIVQVVRAGVVSIVSAGQMWVNAFSFVGAMIATASAALAQTPKLLVWVGGLIATGAQAVWAAGKMTVEFLAAMAKTIGTAIVDAALLYGTWIAALIATGVQAVIAAGKMSIDFVAALFKVGGQAAATSVEVDGVAASEGAAGTAATGAIGSFGAGIGLLGLAGALALQFYWAGQVLTKFGAWLGLPIKHFVDDWIGYIKTLIGWIQDLVNWMSKLGTPGSTGPAGGGPGKPGGFGGPGVKAAGGPVSAGQPYIVGDGGGPELFVPTTNGFIVPARQTQQMLSGGGGHSLTVNNYGAYDPYAISQAVGTLWKKEMLLHGW